MGILLVCHSAGDTEIIMDTAQKVVSKTQDAIYILTVGKTATTKVSTDPLLKLKQVTWIKLSDILSQEEVNALENAPLTSAQVDAIQTYLAPFHIKRALFGTPSQLNARAPFQIAKQLAYTLENGIIYHDYLFYEEEHSFWKIAARPKLWHTKYKWFLPTLMAKNLIDRKFNSEDKSPTAYPCFTKTETLAVGHRAIDSAKDSAPLDEKKVTELRTQLNILPKQSLIFISGTKTTEDDKVLLRALLTCLNNGYEKEGYDPINIRLGLHPGHPDLVSYVLGMKSVINEFKDTPCAHQVKFIVPSSLKGKFSSAEFDSSLFCFTDMSGDDATLASNAVACSMPATLTNKAAILGKPALYYQEQKHPFLPAERLFAGPRYIDLFFKRSLDKKPPLRLTKEELGLSSTEVTETIATALLEKSKLPEEKKTSPKKPNPTSIAVGIGFASIALTITGLIVANALQKQKPSPGLKR